MLKENCFSLYKKSKSKVISHSMFDYFYLNKEENYLLNLVKLPFLLDFK
jgi:hypothetical protein